MIRPSDHQEPKKIAWLQCVGSRDLNHCDNSYCSAVCCMYAIKQAVIAKEHCKNYTLDASIFFMDMRTHGKDFEKYYWRAQDEHGSASCAPGSIPSTRCRVPMTLPSATSRSRAN